MTKMTYDEMAEQLAAVVAENVELKAAMHPELIPDEVLVVFGDTAKYGHDSCDAGSWSWVENEEEVIKSVLGAMSKPETPATDTAVREIEARGVEKFAAHFQSGEKYSRVAEFAREYAAELREHSQEVGRG